MKKRILKILFVLCFVFILLFTSFKTNVKSDEKADTKEETENTEEKVEEPTEELSESKETEDNTSTEIEKVVIETKKPATSNKEIVKPAEPVKKEEVEVEDTNNSETTETTGYNEYTMPSTSGFKSYMSYKAITSTSSPQYKLQRQYAYTGDYGIRQVDGRYCIAIGKFSNSSVGTYVDLVLANGTVIPCVIGDFKANVHTDSNNMVTSHNGCVSEFVVDMGNLNSTAKKMGDMSYCTDAWRSPVKLIRVYDKNVFG